MTRYSIYIGLNDPATHQQLFDTERYIEILKEVCRSYRVPFSFAPIQGGYIYDDGTFTEETTLNITLFDITEETVNEIACDLCTFFRQESVMITRGEVSMYYVRADSEVRELVCPFPSRGE